MCWWLYLERLRWNHHLFGIGYKDFDHSLSSMQGYIVVLNKVTARIYCKFC